MKHVNTFIRGLVTIILVIILPADIIAQNNLDDRGRKTGHWKVEYPNGKTMYEGDFLEGRPVGEMERFTEEGKLKARIRFFPDDKRHVTLFFGNKKKAAEGIYLGKEKDSIWTYYSERDATLRIRESYRVGVLHGPEIRYYPEGGISEQFQWDEGKKEGEWIQYFENGKVRLSAWYKNDLLEGNYKLWSPEGTLVMEGLMSNNVSEGEWKYYDEKGELKYTLVYETGIPTDRELYLEMLEEHMMKIDSASDSGTDGPIQF